MKDRRKGGMYFQKLKDAVAGATPGTRMINNAAKQLQGVNDKNKQRIQNQRKGRK